MGCNNQKMSSGGAAGSAVLRKSLEETARPSPDTVLTQPESKPSSPKPALRKQASSQNRVVFAECDDMGNHEAQEHQRRGNEVAMKKVVDSLYDKVLHDSTLNPFYQGTDMAHLTLMQHKLMSLVFGGKDLLLLDNPEFELRSIHMRALVEGGLTLDNWETFVVHFEETLDALPEIPAETKVNAMTWIRSTRDAFRPPAQEEVEAYRGTSSGAGKCPFH